jgi:pimeloyl-ACP methyl ester carboxylesterase
VTVYSPPTELYPFESNWLQLTDCKMHYLDEGPREAPVVLMLHGNPSWSFYYRNLVVALRDRFRCIVPDHIGCGLSEKPDDEVYSYQLNRRIEDIETLRQHLGLTQDIHLVVHDWGGMIGFGWATRYNADISSTVVLNTAAFPMPEDKRFPFPLWVAGKTPVGTFLVRGLNAFSGLASKVGFKKPVGDEIRKVYTGPYNSWANRIATHKFVQDIPLKASDTGYEILVETESGLHRFATKPGLIAWGELDFVFDKTFLKKWQHHLPESKVHLYPDCGHYILEDAGENLISKISGFLDQCESKVA